MIPITRVEVAPDAERLVLEVLRSGALAQGARVAEFEAACASFCSASHIVAVNNGTTALVAALEALGVQPGDEVITSPFTFVATINAALQVGATVRFADIDPVDYTIDPAALEAAVTDDTRVVMPVHLYGQSAAIGRIAEMAQRRGLLLVEDAAQAHGATEDGRQVGTFGTGCFSLYATKNLTTGEGGLISTSDDDLADRLRVLRNQGMRQRYQYEMVGRNYRMTDLQAALGLAEVARLDEMTERRIANAAALSSGLSGIEGLDVPHVVPGRRHVFHQYTVRVGAAARIDRDTLVEELGAAGIGCGIYYPRAAYDYDCYRADGRVVIEPMPEAERAAREVLSLPVHPWLTDGEIDEICTVLRRLLT